MIYFPSIVALLQAGALGFQKVLAFWPPSAKRQSVTRCSTWCQTLVDSTNWVQKGLASTVPTYHYFTSRSLYLCLMPLAQISMWLCEPMLERKCGTSTLVRLYPALSDSILVKLPFLSHAVSSRTGRRQHNGRNDLCLQQSQCDQQGRLSWSSTPLL